MGINEVKVESADQLIAFFNRCFEQRAVSSTKLNDASSRSHAIYSLHLNRTICDVGDGKVGGSFSSFAYCTYTQGMMPLTPMPLSGVDQ
jgi:hypothetical protein